MTKESRGTQEHPPVRLNEGEVAICRNPPFSCVGTRQDCTPYSSPDHARALQAEWFASPPDAWRCTPDWVVDWPCIIYHPTTETSQGAARLTEVSCSLPASSYIPSPKDPAMRGTVEPFRSASRAFE
ncbi:hypothetical protein BO78DRAFT_241937 [Aspergillus sclerotiicarbonarius CBS 121057]|uniref:Uncharacterized protein n=1 Tax=Aspergillus sclerotiicarbonarius (strain CBS 121057 / IBT 28362) TaxID=1448318 RepID=A0A319E5K0_ASPSB|nr:hypothetical protein BO78DRAFT_241937 [Aspergillus sclerotiicarbonarius CBS 121057]